MDVIDAPRKRQTPILKANISNFTENPNFLQFVIEKKQKNPKKTQNSTLEVSFYPVERQWSHPVPVTFKVNISCLLIDAHGKVRVIHP